MSFAKTPIAFLLVAVIVVPAEAAAQAVSPVAVTTRSVAPDSSPQAKPPALLTLKERLGAKWKDEQRVDNCKVPPEKRGSKPRSDSCAHISMN